MLLFRTIKNMLLILRFPWLEIRNVWTGDKIKNKYKFTWLDDLPEGWRKSFGINICKELDKLLKKGNYRKEYRITQIKEKWRISSLV